MEVICVKHLKDDLLHCRHLKMLAIVMFIMVLSVSLMEPNLVFIKKGLSLFLPNTWSDWRAKLGKTKYPSRNPSRSSYKESRKSCCLYFNLPHLSR